MNRGWGLAWGLVLVGAGAIALLFNLGLVRPEELDRLILLWPLILVLLGVEIVVSRLAPRPASTIAMVAVAALTVAGAIGYVVATPPARQLHKTFAAPDTGSGPATLNVDLGGATIDVKTADLAGRTADVALDYSSGAGGDPTLSWDSGSRTLTVSRQFNGAFFGPSTTDHLMVTLGRAVVWTLSFNTGATTINGDLSQVRVQHVAVDGGAITMTVSLGQPSGHVAVDVNGGATKVDLVRPAGAAIKVVVNGGATSLAVDGRDVGSGVGTQSWSSDSYPAADAYTVTVNGGATRVTVSASA